MDSESDLNFDFTDLSEETLSEATAATDNLNPPAVHLPAPSSPVVPPPPDRQNPPANPLSGLEQLFNANLPFMPPNQTIPILVPTRALLPHLLSSRSVVEQTVLPPSERERWRKVRKVVRVLKSLLATKQEWMRFGREERRGRNARKKMKELKGMVKMAEKICEHVDEMDELMVEMSRLRWEMWASRNWYYVAYCNPNEPLRQFRRTMNGVSPLQL